MEALLLDNLAMCSCFLPCLFFFLPLFPSSPAMVSIIPLLRSELSLHTAHKLKSW